MAPLLRAFEDYADADPVLIHTGQHYDRNLSDVFFEELGISQDEYLDLINLNITGTERVT